MARKKSRLKHSFRALNALLLHCLVDVQATNSIETTPSDSIYDSNEKTSFIKSDTHGRNLVTDGTLFCPGTHGVSINVVPTNNIRIALSSPRTLCTLTLKELFSDGEVKSISPLGRSYEEHDWETVQGPYNLIFDCNEYDCGTSFPILPSDTHVYQLTTFVEDSVSPSFQDKASRFLEQATFGPTVETINALSQGVLNDQDLNDNIKQWIHDEINKVPATPHREVFRDQSTTRFLSTERIGSPLHACVPKTRWHKYTFTNQDIGDFIHVSKTSDDSMFLISVHGIPRTEVDSIEAQGKGPLVAGGSYRICSRKGSIQPAIGAQVRIFVSGSCVNLIGGNPPIKFTSVNPRTPANTMTLSPSRMLEFSTMPGDTQNDDFYHGTGLNDPLCDFLHVGAYPVYLDFTDGNWLALDPRIDLHENTLENVIPDAGGSQELLGAACSNVPRTFLNTDSCVLATDIETCSARYNYPDAEILLTDASVIRLHELSNDYVYAITGLVPEKSPCEPDERSRWELVDISQCVYNNNIDFGTNETLTTLLQNSDGETLRDITYLSRSGKTCIVANTSPTIETDVVVEFESMCWKLVHQDHYSVYEMSTWVSNHPGGSEAIQQFALRGEAFLLFPVSHITSRWDQNKHLFSLIGRLGDAVLYQDLPLTLQIESIAEEYGAEGEIVTGEGVLVCGSPGEVENAHINWQNRYNFRTIPFQDEKGGGTLAQQKTTLWTTLVLNAPDQLRQRMAWALYQILAVSPDGFGDHAQSEFYLTYYDIFVRHAFGNYRDILKEVAYAPAMAKMLSYRRNVSASYNWRRRKQVNFADENFAREVMQLFSIGTVMLELDGSAKLDPVTNTPALSYTNEHIMSFARAWTGFEFQDIRGNIEIYLRSGNLVDPMRIVPEWRDVFPKIDLQGGYIGDGYPLCVDIPGQNFLRKGAKYRLLGSSSLLDLQLNPPSGVETSTKSVYLATTSKLYNKLCKPSTEGGADCNLQNEIVLDENIPCDGQECLVDTLRLVQIADTIFFEYVQPPCVNFPFYDNPKKISNHVNKDSMCADPRSMVASEACCNHRRIVNFRNCEFVGERMKFDTAAQRCASIGREVCNFRRFRTCTSTCCAWIGPGNNFWHDAACQIKVSIDEVGHAALVHSPEATDVSRVRTDLLQDTFHFFPVYWSDDFPTTANQCGNGTCEVAGENCICNTVVDETVAFTSIPQSVDAILSQLYIGSFSPDTFDLDSYNDPIDNGVIKVYLTTGDLYDVNTIFEVEVMKKKKYFKNVRSSVSIIDMLGQKTAFSFRNPPQFMNIAEPTIRDAQYETEAVLDDYFHHPNTAPFLAKYFIQRFGISNPSPRYIETVALAFKNGEYESSFGSGQYGDLEAMLAAVLLDREARSTVASFDPANGSLREPLLKVIGYMRAMAFTPFAKYPTVTLSGLRRRIGQMAHGIESVFSFFEFDFTPEGPVQNAKLVAPEAQRYLTPTIVGLLNGLFSMTKYGLSNCYQGFGQNLGGCRRVDEGEFYRARGKLSFSPSNPPDATTVVNELATLLTAGRLNQESRRIIEEEYNKAQDQETGLRLAQQLISSSPEFHSTNYVQFSGERREIPDPPQPTTNPFKAVTYMMLSGGVDSFNILVPHSECGDKDMYAEYALVRGDVAIPKADLLPITTDNQVCQIFGIHPLLPILKTLYDDGDALFFSNTGVLSEPVTKQNWKGKTESVLFAHNFQQREVMRVDVFDEVAGTGVFGRMSDTLTKLGFKPGSYSVTKRRTALVGEVGKSAPVYSVDSDGIDPFNDRPSTSYMSSTIADVNNVTTVESGIFAKTWSKLFEEALIQTDTILEALNGVQPSVTFPTTNIGKQLKVISEVIQARDRLNVDRQFFMTEMGGFDSHKAVKENLDFRFPQINQALTQFVAEMKALGVWDDVIVIVASDFGRSLTPNSNLGTDHAWGGNYFMIGGGLKGGHILGNYPDNLQKDGPQILRRGRVIPTTSWDSIMNGVAQWLGVNNDADLNDVLPNRENFMNGLFQESDLFTL